MDTSIKHGLLPLVDQAARLTGQHLAAARLADLQRQLDDLDEDGGAAAVLSQVWQAAGLEGAARLLHDPTPGELPFAIYSDSTGWGLLQARAGDGAWRGEGMDGRPLQLASLAGLACIGLPRRSAQSSRQARCAGPGAARAVAEKKRVCRRRAGHRHRHPADHGHLTVFDAGVRPRDSEPELCHLVGAGGGRGAVDRPGIHPQAGAQPHRRPLVQ